MRSRRFVVACLRVQRAYRAPEQHIPGWNGWALGMRWTTNDVVSNRLQVRRRGRDDLPCPGVKCGRGRGGACGFSGVKDRFAQRAVDAAIGIALHNMRMRDGIGLGGMMHGVHSRHEHAPYHEDGKEHRCRNVPPRVHSCAYWCVLLTVRRNGARGSSVPCALNPLLLKRRRHAEVYIASG